MGVRQGVEVFVNKVPNREEASLIGQPYRSIELAAHAGR